MNRKVFILRSTTVIVAVGVLIAVISAFNIGNRANRYFNGVKDAVTLEELQMEGLLEKEVRAAVQKMAAAANRRPVNARYDKKRGIIIHEMPGLQVDVEATVAAVMSAEAGSKVDLQVIRLLPELTAEIFRSINRKVSSFSTTGGGGGGRTDNLYVSAKYMNGTVLAPGDIFSFNTVTGPRTFARGYSMAPVVGGMGIGGGVCQVATTAYNAALLAKLEIIERHPHSIRVYYVPAGKDATVTNYIDMKFRNSTDKYLQIRSGAGGGHVWVQIWSQ